MSKNRFISFRSQILNRKRPEGLIRIYFTFTFITGGGYRNQDAVNLGYKELASTQVSTCTYFGLSLICD
jgi:hypothetical protein